MQRAQLGPVVGRAQCYLQGGGGGDIEMNYDVGFPPRKGPRELLGPWDERKSIGKLRCGTSRTPASLDSTIATIGRAAVMATIANTE